MSGEIHVNVGPMYSGKSTELIRNLTTESSVVSPERILYVNHICDERKTSAANKDITTHNITFSGKTPFHTLKVSKLSDVDVTEYDVIGIDEIQFFTNIFLTILQWKNMGKVIYIVGLDGNSEQETFGGVSSLLPICETFFKLSARCKLCAQEGKRNARASFTICNGIKDREILVGGEEMYSAVCWKHIK